MLSRKIRLQPTKEQEDLFWQSAGVARWSYNYFLQQSASYYAQTQKTLKEGEVRKEITQLKNTTHLWLKDVGSNVPKQAVKDANDARKRWLSGKASKPKPKVKYKSTPRFYVNYETLKATQKGFRGEKIGEIKTCEPLPKLKDNTLYSNPRITHDGLYWYLSVSYDENSFIVAPEVYQLTDEIIGIDVGIKVLAYCSNGMVFENINKTKRVLDLEKRLVRNQRKLARKISDNIIEFKTLKGNHKKPIYRKPLSEVKNIVKQKKVVLKLYKQLYNIRQNHLHQCSLKIVKENPKAIVMEDLNVKGMLKNRHLSKAISKQSLYTFKQYITYKAQLRGIEIVNANRFYASSKTCSTCGEVNKDLTLKDRQFNCVHCGISIDRDYNASKNLANYAIA